MIRKTCPGALPESIYLRWAIFILNQQLYPICLWYDSAYHNRHLPSRDVQINIFDEPSDKRVSAFLWWLAYACTSKAVVVTVVDTLCYFAKRSSTVI